jgi:curved DNA-binding protein CbpA
MIGIKPREVVEESKIKKLFRKKSLLYHPDKFKQMNPNASDAEMEVAQAAFIKL